MTFDERIYQYEFQMNDTDDEIIEVNQIETWLLK